jgi:hypothetical protein
LALLELALQPLPALELALPGPLPALPALLPALELELLALDQGAKQAVLGRFQALLAQG